MPIIGLFLSISNRIGAAMWYVNASLCPLSRLHAVLHTDSRAFDLEKRQHLFAKHIFPPLQPHQTGFYGSGIVTDLGVDIQKAEDEIDAEFSTKPGIRDL